MKKDAARIKGAKVKGTEIISTALKRAWNTITQMLLELAFPRRCPVCDRPVKPSGAYICSECRDKLVYIKEPSCRKCGKQLAKAEKEYCYDCGNKKHIYDRGAALYSYNSIRLSLYRLKYGGRQEYAVFLGQDMAGHLGKEILSWRPDALVPVPLHPAREKKRGYNQATLLAAELGKQLGIPVLVHFVERTRDTRPQKELEGARRQNNLKKAFKIVQNDVKLNTIVIIDDIYTTGSTIDAVAQACRDAGVKHVYFAALAIGRGM